MTNRKEVGGRYHLLIGDCLEVMKTLPDNHFEAVLTYSHG
ncbi:MAG: hypothetical protein DDT21_01859 [Syntrophomonadaceae bacterium]|nr:hypothetical protein [Bacillota bacterium]